MSGVEVARLPVTERARMMRELEHARMKDKSYQQQPIGREVGRYLRQFKWAGSQPNSVEAYESVLAAFAKDFADLEIAAFGSGGEGRELLLWWLDKRWGDSATNTKGRNTAIIRSFFRWAEDEGLVDVDPAAKIRGPRVRSRERRAYDQSTLHRLVAAQPTRRDQCALQLLCRMGLRKNELRVLRVGDIDLVRDLITVHGKGDKIAVLPIAFATLRDDLSLHVLADDRAPDEYLLYPREQRRRPMDQASVHRWFKRCLETARLPESIKMHELRHSAADSLWRVTGNIVLAQQLLRHESVGTTQTYLHPTREDLSAGMRLAEELWTRR